MNNNEPTNPVAPDTEVEALISQVQSNSIYRPHPGCLLRTWLSNSAPHRIMNYWVTPEGEVRYPGDGFERTLTLLESMRLNPPVLTDRSLFRTRTAKEPRTFKITPNVSAAQLDASYALYESGELPLEQMWSDLNSFIQARSTKEQNDFGFRARGLTPDVAQEFFISLRPAIENKVFKGSNGSTFHTYVQTAWHRHKTKKHDALKREESLTISSNPGDETTDSDGSPVQRVSIEDQYSLERFNAGPWMPRPSERRMKLELLKLTLEGAELTVLEDMLADVPQDVTATKIGKSRHAIGRMRRNIIAALDGKQGKTAKASA